VLVVTEFRLLGEGLAVGFEHDDAIAVIGVAGDVRAAVALAAGLAPDVVLLDMSARSAPVLTRRLRVVAPEAALVALAIEDAPGSVAACAESGIAGYVPRTATLEQLRDTILRVARGESPCSPRAAAGLFRRIAALAAELDSRSPAAQLTRRETEVLNLLESGLSNREIAGRLSIALPAVKNHVHNILSKLDARRRGEAVALRRG
jgi:DNA-binding NarL/FixJ family response regulator